MSAELIHHSFEFLRGRLDVCLYERAATVCFILPSHLSEPETVEKGGYDVITIEDSVGDAPVDWNDFYADGLTGIALAEKERTLAKEYGEDAVAVKLFADNILINEFYEYVKLKSKNKLKPNKTK